MIKAIKDSNDTKNRIYNEVMFIYIFKEQSFLLLVIYIRHCYQMKLYKFPYLYRRCTVRLVSGLQLAIFNRKSSLYYLILVALINP